jgi:hypothetical protein
MPAAAATQATPTAASINALTVVFNEPPIRVVHPLVSKPRARHAYFELIDGLWNETVVRSDAAARLFPDVLPVGFDAALAEAMRAQVPILPIDG